MVVRPRGAAFPIILAGLLFSSPVTAQLGKYSLRDLTVIGEFSHITAVATSTDRVYLSSRAAIVTWNPLERRWAGPWLAPQPGMLRDVLAGIADQLGGGVWLVRQAGWVYFDPVGGIWESGTVPGRVLSAALDDGAPGSGLFLRTTAGWYLAARGGIATPSGAPMRPVYPATVEQAARDNPAISATSASLLGLTRFRDVRFTAAARGSGFTGIGWYIGTFGAGLLFYPDGGGLPEPMPFGLPRGVPTALFPGNGGVWVATARSAEADAAVSFVSDDLGSFRWWQGPPATGLPFAAARRMVGRGDQLWLATDVGAIELRPLQEEVRRFDYGNGLPDSRVTDLAQRRGVVAIATERGVVRWEDSTGFTAVATDFVSRVDAIALSGDTTWIGTRLGLYLAVQGNPSLQEVPGLGASPSLRIPVVDLAWLADTLVALAPDRLLWRDPGTGKFTLGPLLGAPLGRLHTVIAATGGVIVAGQGGVGFTPLESTPARRLGVPGDLPGEVLDITVEGRHLWIATTAGLVRLALEVLGL
ncbi:MAG: hypothetical protein OEV95_05845 [Gemmatimonadota bacterium]|nr:hypothetical protein [Gemmatimonadota bacterium]